MPPIQASRQYLLRRPARHRLRVYVRFGRQPRSSQRAGHALARPRLNRQRLESPVIVMSSWGGARHVIALKSDGTVWPCGQNFNGETGNGVSSTFGVGVPVRVS